MFCTEKDFRGSAKKVLAGKVLQFVLSMLALILIVFFVSRFVPGDPLQSYYGESLERMGIQQQEAAREQLGLNKSLPIQFVCWAKSALHGDFGISFKYKQDVTRVIGNASRNTIALTLTCLIIIFLLSLALAVFCVEHEGKWADDFVRKLGIATNSIPEFFAAIMLIFIFSVSLKILPSSGAYEVGYAGSIGNRIIHMILPVCTLVITHLWYCAYMMRNKLSEETRKEYVLLYKVKGLGKAGIYRHCIKNIMPASISMVAVFLPHLIGGAYVIEAVFSYPGLGSLGFESVKYHDYNLLMVISMITGASVILFNMAAQIICEWIDPRVKQEGRADNG